MSRRVELGLEGGGVLVVTVDDAEITAISDGLTGNRAFHEVKAEEGDHLVDLAKVTYLRVLPGEAKARLGFGGGS